MQVVPAGGQLNSSYKVTTMDSLCLLQCFFLIVSYLMFHVSRVVFAKCANRTTGTCWPYKCHTNTVWESLTVTVKVVVFVPFCPNVDCPRFPLSKKHCKSEFNLNSVNQAHASFNPACQSTLLLFCLIPRRVNLDYPLFQILNVSLPICFLFEIIIQFGQKQDYQRWGYSTVTHLEQPV